MVVVRELGVETMPAEFRPGELVTVNETGYLAFENKDYGAGSLDEGGRRVVRLRAGLPYLFLGSYDNPKFCVTAQKAIDWNAMILVDEEVMITMIQYLEKFTGE